jgi:predicted exporter
MVRELGAFLPRLVSVQDLEEIEARLAPQEVEHYLRRALEQLIQPQGMVVKQQLQRDPLDLERLALQKLRHLNPIPRTQVRQGHFLSADGRSTLILADTPVEITDSAGAEKLIQAFHTATAELPAEIKADLISAHAYTLANAEVIQADVQRVLLLSALGILLVFALVLRSVRAIAVYLIPLLAMLGAVQITALFFERVSGITLGFGAVLLGITIDSALHVYFALRHGAGPLDGRLQAVARPVSFGAFTTMAAFALLLGSDLPAQRQLAVFAMSGIAVALVLALVLLPQLVASAPQSVIPAQGRQRRAFTLCDPRLRAGVIGVWLILVLSGVWYTQKLHINGSLRELSYTPNALHEAERQLTQNWGAMRGRALIFAAGADLDQALARNGKVWEVLQERHHTTGAVSVAPLLSSTRTQNARFERWKEFWRTHTPEAAEVMRQRAAAQGFAPRAFDPFWERVREEVPVLSPERLRAWGLGQMLDALILPPSIQGENAVPTYRVLTLVPDTPAVVTSLAPELDIIPGVNLVSQTNFGTQLAQAVGADFKRFIVGAALVVVAFLFLLFRRLSLVLLALIPVATGLVAMYGGMGWLGLELNMFNVVASILIIGLGVDYGIFMVCQGQERVHIASGRAILLSGITTLIGFGVLVLARHPALHSIGVTVLLGISAAVPAAVLVIPALRGSRHFPQED